MSGGLRQRLVDPRLWLFLGVLLACCWPFPYFPRLGSPNELSRLYLTRAVVDDGSLALDGPVGRYGRIADLASYQGRLYSDKAPGIGLLGVPVYAAAKLLVGWNANAVSNQLLLRLLRLFLSALPTALAALLLYGLLQRLLIDRALRLWLSTTYALGTVAYPYGVILFGHQAAACCLLVVVYLLVHPVRPRSGGWFGLGAALAAAVVIEYTTVLAALPLGLAAAWRGRRTPGRTVWALAGAALPAALLLSYHALCFGSPFSTGYAHLAHRSFAAVHEQGLFGLVSPELSRLGNIMFSPTRGLLFFTPWLVLAPVGMVAGWLRPVAGGWRLLWLAAALVCLAYLLFAGSLQLAAWGWSLGPRHLAPVIPLLVLAAARLAVPGTVGRNWTRRALWVLGWYSVIVVVTPTLVFGGYPPDFTNPLADFIVPLAARGCLGPNLGSQLGLPVGWAAAGFALALAAVLAALQWSQLAPRRERLLAAVLGVALAGLPLFLPGRQGPRQQRTREWVATEILGCPRPGARVSGESSPFPDRKPAPGNPRIRLAR